MKIISVKQLRENFDQVKQAMESGQSLILVYRSKPLAEIRPFFEEESELSKKVRIKKNLEKVKSLAGGLKLGKGLTPKKLNDFYEETYEQVLP